MCKPHFDNHIVRILLYIGFSKKRMVISHYLLSISPITYYIYPITHERNIQLTYNFAPKIITNCERTT